MPRKSTSSSRSKAKAGSISRRSLILSANKRRFAQRGSRALSRHGRHGRNIRMQDTARSGPAVTKQQILDRVGSLIPIFAKRAEAAEQSRRLPAESVKELLEAGLARILMPPRFGGYGLGFDTWFDVTREISKADASHGWCASLIIHHAHCIAQFPQEAQEAVWADCPDVAIAASFLPGTTIVPADGGYR